MNQEELQSFTRYCQEHPSERFWQALRNWSNKGYILTAEERDNDGNFIDPKDTFYE